MTWCATDTRSLTVAVKYLQKRTNDDVTMGEVMTSSCEFFYDTKSKISQDFSKRIAEILKLTFRGNLYIPSVYQLRYISLSFYLFLFIFIFFICHRFKGSKGVVTTDPKIKSTLILRPSLKKFDCVGMNNFGYVDHSRPYRYLNYVILRNFLIIHLFLFIGTVL